MQVFSWDPRLHFFHEGVLGGSSLPFVLATLPPPPLSLQVYWVDLDYLQVASAAIQCRAFFTALLYLEAWCEDKYGRLQLGPPAAPVPAPEPAAAGRKRRGEAAAPAPAAAGGLRGGGVGGCRWRV